MRSLAKIFFTGLLISFLGSLPLATMNVAAMQISVSDGVMQAIFFSLGSLIVEMIYVRVSLVALSWIRKQRRLLKILDYVTLVIVLALAISSFYGALHPESHKNIVLSSQLPKVLLGAFMCAVSPAQIPFWLGWSTVLFTKKILLPRKSHYNFYILGIGVGTFLGNCIFIFGGLLIASRINDSQHIFSWIIGGIFLVTAIIQLYQILRKKDTVEKLDHPETIELPLEEAIEKIILPEEEENNNKKD
jgi:threonine/homoserine/homoserine lactone efflux protein